MNEYKDAIDLLDNPLNIIIKNNTLIIDFKKFIQIYSDEKENIINIQKKIVNMKKYINYLGAIFISIHFLKNIDIYKGININIDILYYYVNYYLKNNNINNLFNPFIYENITSNTFFISNNTLKQNFLKLSNEKFLPIKTIETAIEEYFKNSCNTEIKNIINNNDNITNIIYLLNNKNTLRKKIYINYCTHNEIKPDDAKIDINGDLIIKSTKKKKSFLGRNLDHSIYYKITKIQAIEVNKKIEKKEIKYKNSDFSKLISFNDIKNNKNNKNNKILEDKIDSLVDELILFNNDKIVQNYISLLKASTKSTSPRKITYLYCHNKPFNLIDKTYDGLSPVMNIHIVKEKPKIASLNNLDAYTKKLCIPLDYFIYYTRMRYKTIDKYVGFKEMCNDVLLENYLYKKNEIIDELNTPNYEKLSNPNCKFNIIDNIPTYNGINSNVDNLLYQYYYLNILNKHNILNDIKENIKNRDILNNSYIFIYNYIKKNISKLFNSDKKSIPYEIQKCIQYMSNDMIKDKNKLTNYFKYKKTEIHLLDTIKSKFVKNYFSELISSPEKTYVSNNNTPKYLHKIFKEFTKHEFNLKNKFNSVRNIITNFTKNKYSIQILVNYNNIVNAPSRFKYFRHINLLIRPIKNTKYFTEDMSVIYIPLDIIASTNGIKLDFDSSSYDIYRIFLKDYYILKKINIYNKSIIEDDIFNEIDNINMMNPIIKKSDLNENLISIISLVNNKSTNPSTDNKSTDNIFNNPYMEIYKNNIFEYFVYNKTTKKYSINNIITEEKQEQKEIISLFEYDNKIFHKSDEVISDIEYLEGVGKLKEKTKAYIEFIALIIKAGISILIGEISIAVYIFTIIAVGALLKTYRLTQRKMSPKIRFITKYMKEGFECFENDLQGEYMKIFEINYDNDNKEIQLEKFMNFILQIHTKKEDDKKDFEDNFLKKNLYLIKFTENNLNEIDKIQNKEFLSKIIKANKPNIIKNKKQKEISEQKETDNKKQIVKPEKIEKQKSFFGKIKNTTFEKAKRTAVVTKEYISKIPSGTTNILNKLSNHVIFKKVVGNRYYYSLDYKINNLYIYSEPMQLHKFRYELEEIVYSQGSVLKGEMAFQAKKIPFFENDDLYNLLMQTWKVGSQINKKENDIDDAGINFLITINYYLKTFYYIYLIARFNVCSLILSEDKSPIIYLEHLYRDSKSFYTKEIIKESLRIKSNKPDIKEKTIYFAILMKYSYLALDHIQKKLKIRINYEENIAKIADQQIINETRILNRVLEEVPSEVLPEVQSVVQEVT